MNKFYYWPDSNKPLQNITFMLGTRDADWCNYSTLFSLCELTGANKRSMN